MTRNARRIAAWVIVPAVGLATWAWFAMARVDADLRSVVGFEAKQLDI